MIRWNVNGAHPGDPTQALLRTLAGAIRGETTDMGAWDDDHILIVAEDQGISQLVADRVHQGLVSGLGADARSALSAQKKAQAASDMLMNRSAQAILAELSAAGVPALLLKGMPIAHLYYTRTYHRPRTDTDLFIPEDRVECAERRLGELGYRIFRESHRKLASKQFVATTPRDRPMANHFDLHWRLSNRVLFREALLFEECQSRRQAVPALGPDAYSLEACDLLMHACIHRIAHGRNAEPNRLIWLYDIHLLIEAMSQTEKTNFVRRALEKSMGTLCADGVQATQAWFKTDFPSEGVSEMRSNQKREPSAGLLDASAWRWALADMMALPGIRLRLSYAGELLRSRLTR